MASMENLLERLIGRDSKLVCTGEEPIFTQVLQPRRQLLPLVSAQAIRAADTFHHQQ
jgi:hypothetical protein